MNLPCGHAADEGRHLQGKPWVTDNGRHLACRVCWWHWNVQPYRPRKAPPPPPPPKPVEEWPRWAKALAKRRRPGEAGVGDTLARVLGHLGGTAFKLAYRKLTGKDCGCDRRQALMNGEYPYP